MSTKSYIFIAACFVLSGVGCVAAVKHTATLLNQLRSGAPPARREAAWVLGSHGTAALVPLLAALRDEDAEVRYAAAWSLGDVGDDRAVSPLTGALADPERAVQNSAALALVKIGTEQAKAAVSARRRALCGDVLHPVELVHDPARRALAVMEQRASGKKLDVDDPAETVMLCESMTPGSSADQVR